jgi:hypothetical protein
MTGYALHSRSTAVVSVDANTVKGTDSCNSAHLQVSEIFFYKKIGERFTVLSIAPSFYIFTMYLQPVVRNYNGGYHPIF